MFFLYIFFHGDGSSIERSQTCCYYCLYSTIISRWQELTKKAHSTCPVLVAFFSPCHNTTPLAHPSFSTNSPNRAVSRQLAPSLTKAMLGTVVQLPGGLVGFSQEPGDGPNRASKHGTDHVPAIPAMPVVSKFSGRRVVQAKASPQKDFR